MAIAPSDIRFTSTEGVTIPSGALHALFATGTVNAATDYALVEVRNAHATLTFSAGKAWLTLDTDGAAVALAVGDGGVARASSYEYAVTPSSLTYSTPTSQSAGLTLPSLGPGQKCLVAIRRTLTGASPAYPETNRLNVAGTSPL